MRRCLPLVQIALALLMLTAGVVPATAREGDTLLPITIDAPTLETWPKNLLEMDTDYRLINQRVHEARNGGVPLAVRIVDMTLPEDELPFQIRRFAEEDFSQPFTPERQQEILESWIRSETIETSEGANDGFLLLVLVPEDRSDTKAMWWIGPNALPLNGLTEQNIAATHGVMNEQFARGNMPNGVFLGISEFSYNIQFGTPERLERSTLQNALHMATIPMAIVTALAGLGIPVMAIWLSRRNNNDAAIEHHLTPWEAAALQRGRARAEIPTAMLLHAYHRGEIVPTRDGGLQIASTTSGEIIDKLRAFADDDGTVDAAVMYEIAAITEPVRQRIERRLMKIGAMTPDAARDQYRTLIVMGITLFMVALSAVPSVVSMSATGIFGMALGIMGVATGWWWLAYRRYTSPAGTLLLQTWLESANDDEMNAFNTVIHQDLLIDPVGGPDVPTQMQFIRRIRGLGSA